MSSKIIWQKYIALALICYFNSHNLFAEEWHSSFKNSQLSYTVNFEGNGIHAQFNDFDVFYQADQKNSPQKIQVNVTIASVDMGNDDLNATVKQIDWFDSNQYQFATFTSSEFSINKTCDVTYCYIANGAFTLKGITKNISVPLNIQQLSTKLITMQGELLLNRSDFSIGGQQWLNEDKLAFTVQVHFKLTMQRHTKEGSH